MKIEMLALALFVYTFAAWGFCWVVAGSKISRPLRELVAYFAAPATRSSTVRVVASFTLALLECPACLGFHVGWITGLVLGRSYLTGVDLAVAAITLGFYTTGVNIYILGRTTGIME